MRHALFILILPFLLLGPRGSATAQPTDILHVTAPSAAARDDGPRVLIVTAHPDDEAVFAASVYRITHDLGGLVDLAVLTDGSGGYRFAGLAEPLYGRDLDDEATARQYLPAIRKQELMAGGRIIGIRNYFFFDQEDPYFTLTPDSVLTEVWDTDYIAARLTSLMERERYDFVFAHLPIASFHGHHKAATILALRAAERLALDARPIVLGAFPLTEGTPPPTYTPVPGHPATTLADAPPHTFDRNRGFGPDERLNYKIVVNWLIAEHKSQGTMQLLMNRGDLEAFWRFALPARDAEARTAALFERLGE